MMAIPLLGAAGMIGSALSGFGASKAAKKAAGEQAAVGKRMRRTYDKVNPLYLQTLDWYARRAGLPGIDTGGAPTNAVSGQGGISPATAARMGLTQQQPGMRGRDAYSQRGVLPNSALGIWGSNPEDVMRMNQAQEGVDLMAQQRQQMLMNRLGRQGIGGSTMASAVGNIDQDAFRQLADFRRNLALSAGQEEERRMANVMGGLGPGISMGEQGANMSGQQANMYGQQAQGAMDNIGQLMQLYAQRDAMRRGGGDYYGGGGNANRVVPWAPYSGGF